MKTTEETEALKKVSNCLGIAAAALEEAQDYAHDTGFDMLPEALMRYWMALATADEAARLMAGLPPRKEGVR